MTRALAVMDAVGISSADTARATMMLAATHPERVRALALINACARFERAPDHPQGAPPAVAAETLAN